MEHNNNFLLSEFYFSALLDRPAGPVQKFDIIKGKTSLLINMKTLNKDCAYSSQKMLCVATEVVQYKPAISRRKSTGLYRS